MRWPETAFVERRVSLQTVGYAPCFRGLLRLRPQTKSCVTVIKKGRPNEVRPCNPEKEAIITESPEWRSSLPLL